MRIPVQTKRRAARHQYDLQLFRLKVNTVHFRADAISSAADPPVAKSGDIPLVKGDK